jgi:fumarate reductase subunit C
VSRSFIFKEPNMSKTIDVIAGTGLDQKIRKSHWPARLDIIQSATGLFLALFMWGHSAFVSTILVSNDAMWWVTRMFEGQFISGQRYPGIVSSIVALVAMVFVLHGLLAMRKFPANFSQYKAFAAHRKMMRHDDTTYWWFQAASGFMLFFLASVHLYQMLMHPGDIGPYESADEVWSYRWWPLLLGLLFAVQLHSGAGLYRLVLKWGWFEGEDPNRNRRLLKRFRVGMISFFVVLGLLSLGTYMKIGYEHRNRVGEPYVPSYVQGSGTSSGMQR